MKASKFSGAQKAFILKPVYASILARRHRLIRAN
jgi:hypothetical protein